MIKTLRKLLSKQGKEGCVTTVFLVLLGSSLFLGDGKQTFIEVFWSLGIVLLYIWAWRKRIKLAPLSSSFLLGWTAFIIYSGFSLVISHSPGYSVSALVRVLAAFLVFRLFYGKTAKQVHFFVRALLLLIEGAAIVSLGLIFFPELPKLLPSTNLLFATYGHNHLSVLLLLILPLVFERMFYEKSPRITITFLILVAAFILTFSHSAYLVLIGYLFVRLVVAVLQKEQARFLAVSIPLFIGIALSLFASYFLLFAPKIAQQPNNFFVRQLGKNSLEKSRLNYWTQALTSFSEEPFFGWGGGTFYLESKRLQKEPFTYSYYAHSSVLQTLSELGIAGTSIFFALLILGFLQLKEQFTAKDIYRRGLSGGLLLVFILSCIDFSLDFFTVWLLFWGALSFLSSSKSAKENSRFLGLIFLALVGLLYFGVTSALVYTQRLDKKTSFLLAPFRVNAAHDYITSNTFDAFASLPNTLLFSFHPTDPDILGAYAQANALQQHPRAKSIYLAAIASQPTNPAFHVAYLDFLNDVDPEQLPPYFMTMLHALTKHLSSDLLDTIQLGPKQIPFIQNTLTMLHKETNPKLYTAKLLYLTGLEFLDTKPEYTRDLWTLARDIAPHIGLLHHELASLYLHIFSDKAAAYEIVNYCMTIEIAALHCKQIDPDLKNLTPPGFVQAAILSLH